MTLVWDSAAFRSMAEVAAFLTERQLEPRRFKIVPIQGKEGTTGFQVLFLVTDQGVTPSSAIVEAELLPVVEAAEAHEAAVAVDAAEAIIASENTKDDPR